MWSISSVVAVGSWCPQLVQVCASRLSMRRLVAVGTCLVVFVQAIAPPFLRLVLVVNQRPASQVVSSTKSVRF